MPAPDFAELEQVLRGREAPQRVHLVELGIDLEVLRAAAHRHLGMPWISSAQERQEPYWKHKMFWYHCCGNVYRSGVLKDLIEDVGIDAFHAFQDQILPVAQFQARYGRQVVCLGGVDVDCLARLTEGPLRAYVREILTSCMPGGRFALGSGSTVTNYVPLNSYLAMLDESYRWQSPDAGT
jgi:uroporphyrinogen decarboxylase